MGFLTLVLWETSYWFPHWCCYSCSHPASSSRTLIRRPDVPAGSHLWLRKAWETTGIFINEVLQIEVYTFLNVMCDTSYSPWCHINTAFIVIEKPVDSYFMAQVRSSHKVSLRCTYILIRQHIFVVMVSAENRNPIWLSDLSGLY